MRRCFLHRAQGDGMAAMVVGAVDQDAANAHVAHLAGWRSVMRPSRSFRLHHVLHCTGADADGAGIGRQGVACQELRRLISTRKPTTAPCGSRSIG